MCVGSTEGARSHCRPLGLVVPRAEGWHRRGPVLGVAPGKARRGQGHGIRHSATRYLGTSTGPYPGLRVPYKGSQTPQRPPPPSRAPHRFHFKRRRQGWFALGTYLLRGREGPPHVRYRDATSAYAGKAPAKDGTQGAYPSQRPGLGTRPPPGPLRLHGSG